MLVVQTAEKIVADGTTTPITPEELTTLEKERQEEFRQLAEDLEAEFRRLEASEFVCAVVAFGEPCVLVKDGPIYPVDDDLLVDLQRVPNAPVPRWNLCWYEHIERVLLMILPRTTNGSKTRPVPNTHGILAMRRLRNPLWDVLADQVDCPKHHWVIVHRATDKATPHQFLRKQDALRVAEELYGKIDVADWRTTDAQKLGGLLQSAAGDWLREEVLRSNAI